MPDQHPTPSDNWQSRLDAMNADAAFMRWLADYLPDHDLEYSGDLLGMYDAWRAGRAEAFRECREKVAELKPHYDGIFPYGRVAVKDVFAAIDALGGQP